MLDYIALGFLIFAAVVMFYGIIVIHDIPYEISVSRNHPHQDAIHYAGWISLFTLHVLWPFLWIWATLYREDRGWGFAHQQNQLQTSPNANDCEDLAGETAIEREKETRALQEQLQKIEQRLSALEKPPAAEGDLN
ncbi:MAG: DUF3302 domain-containing protein [Cellvibrionaceae bacterium]